MVKSTCQPMPLISRSMPRIMPRIMTRPLWHPRPVSLICSLTHSCTLACLIVIFCLIPIAAATSSDSSLTLEAPQCQDISTSKDKCLFAKEHCIEENIGYFNYLAAYYCAGAAGSAFILISLLIWICVLFMTIGIAASDFLCPNLNTMANLWGLSESLAGVTFLAFGNGSPDVFSTYAAMKMGSGSLAVGELIGAACFITAVVAGSMAIIRPFKVARKSFIRDIGFFTVAVAFSMFFLSDGILQMWECIGMLVLYLCYVIFVVCWHWINTHRRKQYLVEARSRDFYTEHGEEQQIEQDDEVPDSTSILSQGLDAFGFGQVAGESNTRRSTYSTTNRTYSGSSLANWAELSEEEQEEAYGELTRIMRVRHTGSPVSHPIPPHSPITPIRPSLFGALEFRSVIHELEDSKSSISNHHIPLHLRYSDEEEAETQNQPPATVPDQGPPLLSPIPVPESLTNVIANLESNSDVIPVALKEPSHKAHSPKSKPSIPHLIVTEFPEYRQTPTPRPSVVSEEEGYGSEARSPTENMPHKLDEIWDRRPQEKTLLSVIFPTLIGISRKPWYGIASSITAAPAVLLLTVTTPVIESDPIPTESPSIDPQYHHVLPLDPESKFPINRWLLMVQAIFAPILVLSFTFPELIWYRLILFSALGSLVLLFALLYFVTEPNFAGPNIRNVSVMGFVIAISWVSTIATEVVGVLKALGIILHISDAVLGLTVFAMGNSLGDLIANVTVAKMGFPMMALSACFGGPMLNILVGVGVSGLVVLSSSAKGHHEPLKSYSIEISSTLVISGATLMVTLVFLAIAVPLNDWRMSRRIGLTTVTFWVVSTTANVLLEIFNH